MTDHLAGEFGVVGDVAALMEGYGHSWCLAGGWALDAFLGRVTREHADLEISILRQDQAYFRDYLAGWEFSKAVTNPEGEGGWYSWPEGEFLERPLHQIRARRDRGRLREVEAFLNEGDATRWHSRRHEGLSRPLCEAWLDTPLRVPVVAPEIQLLYKAKYHRPKDDLDFNNVLPYLSVSQRQWLRAALEQYHPGDAWIPQL
jgi:hypothetical protein